MRKVMKNYLRLLRAGGLSQVLAFHRARRSGAETVGLTIHGQAIRVRPRAPDLGVAINNLGQEFASVRDLPQLRDCHLVIDAGAFIGSAALALAELFPQARVVSIEPSPENFAMLEENTRHHPRIQRIMAALVPAGAPSSVRLRDRGTGQWGLSITPGHGGKGAQEGIEVATIALPDILATHAAGGPVFCKMDIEGAEYALLETASDWLDRCDVLAIELHERIVAGTDEAFRRANHGRDVRRMSSDKYLSVKTA